MPDYSLFGDEHVRRYRVRQGVRATLLLAMLLAGSTGCSPLRPVLYPNAHFRQVGDTQAQSDIEYCCQQADQFVKSGGQSGRMARDTAVQGAKGGAFGGAVGAAGGAVTGNAGEGAAVGAASGATAGVLNTLFGGIFETHRSPDPTYANFVNQCLTDRGYQVIGWQ
jgi:outer membrane lipoprotein SlyB